MTFCFDIDDTLSRHKKRDYANAEPIPDVIEKMRQIRATVPNCRIVLYTARGMASCNGNVREAELRNRPILESWLESHNVPYDEIVFGKPLADIYVDDKAMLPEQFCGSSVAIMHGFSGAAVLRIGPIVVKQCSEAEAQYEWYKACEVMFPQICTPKALSIQIDRIYMEYIDGKQLSHTNVTKLQLHELLGHICSFGRCCLDTVNHLSLYIEHSKQRAEAVGIDFEETKQQLLTYQERFYQRTFCHGDLTLSNVLLANDGSIHLIDPVQKTYFSSHWLDYAKLRCSLRGLDHAIDNTSFVQDNALLRDFDERFSEDDLLLIRLLERTHLVRVMYYAKQRGQEKELSGLRDLYE